MLTLASRLLVDDDPTIKLTRMGAVEQVLMAENGEQALRMLVQTCAAETTTCPQLIPLDMNRPMLDGLAFLEAQVQLPLAQRQAIVIVVLTTSLHPVDLARAEEHVHSPIKG